MTSLYVILGVSLLLLYMGLHLWRRSNRLQSKGKKTIASVVSNVRDDSGHDGPMFYAVVKFTTEKHETISKQRNVGYSNPEKIGTRINILYDPENPEDFEVQSTFNLEIFPRLLTALGVGGAVWVILEIFDVVDFL